MKHTGWACVAKRLFAMEQGERHLPYEAHWLGICLGQSSKSLLPLLPGAIGAANTPYGVIAMPSWQDPACCYGGPWPDQ